MSGCGYAFTGMYVIGLLFSLCILTLVPSTPVHFANGMKSYSKKPSYMQDSAADPSEDQPWPRGTLRHIPESPFGLSGGLREGSLSSQDSRTESASLSQSQVNGFFASHLGDRGWQEPQHGSPSPSVTSKVTEKTFSNSNRSKARRPGISDVIEHPDCADSDIDDSTYTSSQDHQTPKQAWFNFLILWGGALCFHLTEQKNGTSVREWCDLLGCAPGSGKEEQLASSSPHCCCI